MNFREPIENRVVLGDLRKQAVVISNPYGVTLHNSHCPCVCREILAVILEEGENNVIKKISYGMGKEGICYYLGLLSGAQFCLEQCEKKGSVDYLNGAMLSSRGNTTMFCWLPSVLAALCKKALEVGIEEDYMNDFIRSYNLFPERPPPEVGTWPWPVKIHVLGKFELALDGKPVRFSGKVQRKPLQMLKTIIALGGHEVGEEQLTDLLWPDADGDRAHSAFTTTLSRLRHVIGFDKAIEIYAGKASLNPRYCWVDLWAFEEICGQVDAILEETGELGKEANRNRETIVQLAERAIGMYGGPLLPGETDQSWVAPLRERLNNRFHRLIKRFGKHLEEKGEWGKAAKYYQMTLEMDETTDEEIYRRLMICHHRLDQPAKVIEAYRRCSKALAVMLGIKPSPKTEIIYKDLIISMDSGTGRGGPMI